MPAKKTTTRKASTNKKTEVANQKVMDAVSGLSAETVINQIGELQVNLQATLAGLGAAVTSKVEQMQNVEQAIALKEQELKVVYDIEQEALVLEDIKAQREKDSEDWEKEKLSRQVQWDEDDEEREKRWQREEEEHLYRIQQQNVRTHEEHKSLVDRNRRNEQIRQEELTRSWTEREDSLKGKEEAFNNLKAKVEGFDELLKTEVKKTEAITENRIKRQYEHDMQLLQKDIEAEKNLHSIKVSAMDETIKGLEEQIVALQRDLASARADAKEVTNAALQSASGRQVVEALSKVDNSGNSSKK